MIIIRQAITDDVETLLKLAKMVFFINLPPDEKVILDKVRWSRACFSTVRAGNPDADSSTVAGLTSLGGAAGRSPQFMFVAEDTESGNPIGCSAVISQMGSETHPSVTFELRKKEFFSEDLQSGATHVTANLFLDTSGPSEIGGLIVAPSYRGHPTKVGKQLSHVRFHYIGMHRERFKDKMIAEMMAAISESGHNPFWEHCSRRFINLSYEEADRFCQKSREFMISLLPHDPIYLTLLPPEARAVVGKVGPDTLPARYMLERLGFVHGDKVDPFDAGPVLEANTDEIPVVNATKPLQFVGTCHESDASEEALVSSDRESAGGFRAVVAPCVISPEGLRIPQAHAEALKLTDGAVVGYTPYGAGRPAAREASPSKG